MDQATNRHLICSCPLSAMRCDRSVRIGAMSANDAALFNLLQPIAGMLLFGWVFGFGLPVGPSLQPPSG
jgi:hypothetical protein